MHAHRRQLADSFVITSSGWRCCRRSQWLYVQSGLFSVINSSFGNHAARAIHVPVRGLRAREVRLPGHDSMDAVACMRVSFCSTFVGICFDLSPHCRQNGWLALAEKVSWSVRRWRHTQKTIRKAYLANTSWSRESHMRSV